MDRVGLRVKNHMARTAMGAAAGLLCLSSHALAAQADPRDPFESFNRSVYSFNDSLDRALIRPVATAYIKVTPHWMRKGVTNFFGNVGDVWYAINNAITLKRQATGDSVGRVMINSTVGLLGFIDVASDMNIEKHPADFGLTLGRWGMGPGPYVVVPVLGPYTLREVVAWPVDYTGNLVSYVHDIPTRDGLTLLSALDLRASYLKAGEVIDGAALDAYSFTRDSYFQRQRYRLYDGEEPESPEPAP
jgi:phospholipid-binding lipoprotein MlaA